MTHRPFIARTLAATRWLVAAAVFVSAGAGCASSKSDLRVTSLKGPRKTYSQHFSEAYASRNGEGNLDVVLTADAADSTPDGRTTGAAQSLRQVMHVRVLWQPMRGTKRDSPTATNATVDWYVLADTGRTKEMIEYSGAAFVTPTRKGNVTILDIRNASLKPTARQGNLNDPIGPAKLEGTIVARNSGPRVQRLLAGVKTTLAEVNEQAAARLASEKQASTRLPVEP